MRAPIYKFLAISFVIVLGFSGMNADSNRFCTVDDAKNGTVQTMSTEEVIDFAENKLNKKRTSEEESEGFKFPNVFDALGFIL
ncbi:MAG: hypothetical protein HQ500_01320 [Flavobacteriales bacterium]|nr:hypothetical protein [Flavobacteriales bacterium]